MEWQNPTLLLDQTNGQTWCKLCDFFGKHRKMGSNLVLDRSREPKCRNLPELERQLRMKTERGVWEVEEFWCGVAQFSSG